MASPIVTSITVDQPITTTAHLLTYTVTFSEAVTNVDQADFSLSYAGGMTGVAITDVVSQSGNPADTTWLVTVDAGPDPGWVQIGLVGNDVYDLDGNTVVPPWRVMNYASVTTSDDGRAPDDITGPFYIASGDLNGDGFVDLVTSNPNDNRVAVLFGDGTGAFTQSGIYAVDGAPFGQGGDYAGSGGPAPYGIPADLTLADLDSDGDLDMAVAVLEHFNGTDTDSHSGVAILWNDGSGTYAGSTSDLSGNLLPYDYHEGVGEGPRRVVAGDLDGDGYTDLVVANSYDGTVSVLLNNTEKDFIDIAGVFPTYAVGAGNGDAFDIKLGDVDSDGDLDVIGINASSRIAFVLLGDGLGGFGGAISTLELTTTGSPRGLDVGDIDGDGNLDAVVVNDIDNNVQILLGNGDGTFSIGGTLGVDAGSFSVTLADINGDGRLDILTANRVSNTITVWHGQGDGNFVLQGDANPFLPDAGAYPTDLVVVDANGDTVPDIVATGYHTTNVYTLPGAEGIYLSPSVNIVSSNAPPVAVADSATTDEDTAVTIAVLANDSDAEDGAPLPGTVTDAYGAAHGTLSINVDGTITYTPNADYNGTDSFTYEVTDSLGGTATATVDVTINPVNDPPGATLAGTAVEDVPSPLQLVGTDIDGTVTGFRIVTAPGHGTLTYTDGTGTHTVTSGMVIAAPSTILDLTYISDADFNGLDTVVVSAIDDQGLEETPVTHTIQVLPVNDAPVVADLQQFSGDEDTTITGAIAASDDSTTLTFTLLTGTTHGALTFATDGTFTYLPVADYNGFDGFTYTVDDGDGGVVTRTAELTINPVNDAPGAALAGTALEDVPSPLQLVGTDIDGTVTGFRIVTAPGHGTLTYTDGTGTHTVTSGMVIAAPSTILDLTYISDADFNGLDSVVVSAIDNQGLEEAPVTHTIQVLPVNDAPVFETLTSAVDIVLTNWAYGGSDVTISLGNGDGSFDPGTTHDMGGASFESPYRVALGDVDGDGNIDIVTSSYYEVNIALGNGDGTFAPGTVAATGGGGHQTVVLGDVNGDGALDIVASSYNGALIALGNGDGTFGTGMIVSTGGTANTSVPLGDVNGDGDLDIVTVAEVGDAHVALGNGDGTFGSASAVALGGSHHYSVVFGDVNGDGNLDIISSNTGSVSGADAIVALGNGDGTFGSVMSVETGATSLVYSVVLGDVNNDGNLDIVTSDLSNGAGIALGNGDGTFAAGTLFVTGGDNHYSVALGDLNADGNLDIVVDNNDLSVNGAIVALGNGDGTFGSGIGAASYWGYQFRADFHAIALGDLNPAPAVQDNASLSEDTASVSGVLAFSDVDLADVHTVAPAGTYSGSGTALGTLTASLVTDTTGTGTGGRIAWTYTLDTNAAQHLAEGETKVETFAVSLSDGTGTHTKTVTVTIEGTNDAPVLTETLETIQLGENSVNAGPRLIANFGGPGNPAVTDVDSTSFGGGQIALRWAEITGPGTAFSSLRPEYRTQNELSIRSAGQLAFDGTSVTWGGILIGTVASPSEDGHAGNDLVIDLTANATAARINALIRNLNYQNTSDTPQASRLLTVQVSDGDGGTSTLDTSQVPANHTGVWVINVLPQNDARSGEIHIQAVSAITASSAVLAAVNTITDPDLGPLDSVSTQWQRWSGTTWTDFSSGAALAADTIADPTLAGAMLRAVARYEDAFGSYEIASPERARIGSSGNDALAGTAAADLFVGLGGNDTYTVGAGDRVYESAAGGTDVVRSAAISLDLQSGAYDNVENASLLGADGLDLSGNGASNRLAGNSGANRIDGRGGADIMAGGQGDDTYVVDDAMSERAGGFGDLVRELANAGTDTVEASISYTLRPYVENLQLTGFGAIDGTGNALANAITGNSAANTLNGRWGSDELTGGEGADHFIFDTGFVTVPNIDTITDFEVGIDKIELLSALFAGTGAPGGAIDAAAFHVGAAAETSQHRVIYDDQTGALYYDRDGSGTSRAAVQFAQLDPHLALTYQDLVII